MWRLYEGYGEFYLGRGVHQLCFFLAVITRKNDKFMLSLSKGFRCMFSIKSPVFNKINVY